MKPFIRKTISPILCTFSLIMIASLAWTQGSGDCTVKLDPLSDQYHGNCKNGLAHGQGTYIWANGNLNSATSSDEGTYSSPQDTTEKEKKKDYVIDEKRNIKSVQFVRRRKGHKVKIHFRRMKFIPKRTEYIYFVASSGIKYFDQKPIEIREVEFPFWVRLKFKASNQTQTQFMYYTLHFTINKPGYWEIIMDY
ncbi:MAG: MORN repeat-containing protein [Bacteroidales bacterium]|nr:MORN repeat-containing protein [Bacteroidales bacterium]